MSGTNALRSFILLFSIVVEMPGQTSGINTRLNNGELKMNFPGIYFKHNSTDYAEMPYTVDSCFKYIARHFEDIKSYVIWRDSIEKESLTHRRVQKLRNELNRYMPAGRIYFQSMNGKQKISHNTIRQANNRVQLQFLRSLNSVFEVSSARLLDANKRKKICWFCLLHMKRCQVNTALVARIQGRFP